MLNRFRAFWTKVISPVARLLLRLGVSPDAVTLVGTLGVSAGALWFFPRGQLLAGVLVITAFVFSDLLDGTMARMTGSSSKWGAFLDSTLDRLGDAAIFGGLVMYYVGPGDDDRLAALALYCLVMGSVTSYARARAESLGHGGQGRPRRAGRPARRDPRDDRALGDLRPAVVHPADARGARRRQHDHGGSADPHGPEPGHRGGLMASLAGGLRRAGSAAADQATATGYVAGWRVVRWLPEPTARKLFQRMADEMYRRDGRSVQRLRANLARARPGCPRPSWTR